MNTKKQKIKIYIIFLLTVYAAEFSMISVGQKGPITFFTTYHKPDWALLPIHLLILVWLFLYTLFGIVGAKIWMNQPSSLRKYAMSSWFVIIALNVIWPLIFSYMPTSILTPIVISILFIALIVLLSNSFVINKIAGCLLIPFSFMMLYMLIFHWTFFILNRRLL